MPSSSKLFLFHAAVCKRENESEARSGKCLSKSPKAFASFIGLIVFGVLVATLTMALQPRQFSGDITPIEPVEPHTESRDEPLVDGLNKFLEGLGGLVALKSDRETAEPNLRELDRTVHVGVTVHDHSRLFRRGHIHIDVSVRRDA